MTLKTIRLELGRDAQHPDGDSRYGYEFRAPLTADGHLDNNSWSNVRALCTVRRFTPSAGAEQGLLLKTNSNRWVFSYAPGEDDDEVIFKFSSHRFIVGEYLSITEHDGVVRTFKVVSVQDWHPQG